MKFDWIFDKIYLYIGIPWLFLMLFTSGSFTAVKIGLLAVLFIVALIEIGYENLKINKKYMIFALIFICYCSFSLLIGLIGKYEFELGKDYNLFQYYFLTPICIIVFYTVISSRDYRVKALWNALTYLTCLLVILDTIRIYLFVSGYPASILEFIELYSGNTNTELSLRVTNESSLFFLLPIYIYLFFFVKKKKEKRLYIVIAFFGFLYAMLSGRKILQLEIVLSIIFAWCYKRNLVAVIRKNIKTIFITILLVIIFSPLLINIISAQLGVDDLPQLVVNTMVDGLSSQSHGMSKRLNNASALIHLWEQSPILGNGLNAYADSLANDKTKWSYEIVYVAWLAQTGIVGCILLFVPVVYITATLNWLGNITKKRGYYAIMLGFICFVIAGASNPLVYFVWPWTIALIFCKGYKNFQF